MKHTVFTLALLLNSLFNPVMAQELKNRSKYRAVHDYVLININSDDKDKKDKLEFEIDSHRGDLINRDFNKTIYLASFNDDFNLITRFYNPLVYTFDITEEYSQDPVAATLGSLIGKVSSFNAVIPNLPKIDLPAVSKEELQKIVFDSPLIDPASSGGNKRPVTIASRGALYYILYKALDTEDRYKDWRTKRIAEFVKKVEGEKSKNFKRGGQDQFVYNNITIFNDIRYSDSISFSNPIYRYALKRINIDPTHTMSPDNNFDLAMSSIKTAALKSLELEKVQVSSIKFESEDLTAPITDRIASATFSLTQVRDYKTMRDKIETGRKIITTSRKFIQQNRDHWKEIETLTTTAQNAAKGIKPKPTDIGLTTPHFVQYLGNSVLEFKEQNLLVLDDQAEIVNKFESLLDELEKFTKPFQTEAPNNEIQYHKIQQVNMADEKMLTITITVKYQKFKLDPKSNAIVSDGAQTTVGMEKFVAVNYSPVTVELGTGLIYSNVSFPSYGITSTFGADTTRVKRGKDDQPKVLPLISLNILLTRLRSDLVPLLQIGTSFSNNRPLLMAGVGMRYFGGKNTPSLSLSVGAVYNWKKVLNGIKEGDPVNGTADLDSKTSYEFNTKPSFYIGLQYSF